MELAREWKETIALNSSPLDYSVQKSEFVVNRYKVVFLPVAIMIKIIDYNDNRLILFSFIIDDIHAATTGIYRGLFTVCSRSGQTEWNPNADDKLFEKKDNKFVQKESY